MELGNPKIDLGTQEAIDAKSHAYERARDRGDTLEAARAIIQKINLLAGQSLTREVAKADRDNEKAAFLQNILSWVEDEELQPEGVTEKMMQAVDASPYLDGSTLDAFLQEKLDRDLEGVKSLLETDRDALENKLEAAVKMSSTNSSTQAMSLTDLLNQRDVLMSLDGDLINLVQDLKSSLNSRR